jgi:hypothetical protein
MGKLQRPRRPGQFAAAGYSVFSFIFMMYDGFLIEWHLIGL